MRSDRGTSEEAAEETGDRTDAGDPTAEWSAATDGDATAPSASEAAALRRVRGLSDLLDEAIRIPGTNFRVGLDPILGVLPVGGDAVATVFALYPILEAVRFGLPTATVVKMVLLVAIDGVIGSVPVVGTIFDAFWKANHWNAKTFERHLAAD
jgi:hypothetical protein